MTEETQKPDDQPNGDAGEVGKGQEAGNRPRPIQVAIVLAGVAVGILGYTELRAQLSAPRVVTFDHLTQVSSLDEGLRRADLGDSVKPLVVGDGKIDILYAGAADCSHCQHFVDDDVDNFADLSDLADFARENGLDLSYMPLALSSYGVTLAVIDECLGETPDVAPEERLKGIYSGMIDLRDFESEARAIKDADITDNRTDAKQRIAVAYSEALDNVAGRVAPGLTVDQACMSDALAHTVPRMRSFGEVFGQHGTPSFFFHGEEGEVLHFSGAGGLFQMMEMLEGN